ncbi:hypothetical protein DH86_00003666, partial [Scytalidium sp. 3C]
MADTENKATQPELLLDEVTGDRVSKSELKRRQKQRQKDAEKAQKLASRPAPVAKKANAEAEESQLNPNQYFEIRSRNINKLRESKDPSPYPHKFHVNTDLKEFITTYSGLKSGESRKDVQIQVAGRIYNKRASGTKLIFYDIRSEGVKVQVMCQSQEADGATPFEKQHEHLRRGDIIGIIGYPGRTAPKTKIEKGEEGELSIFAKEVILLTPCLHQLPDEYYGFKDQEQRHRKRYLDLIVSDSTRNVFVTRAKMITYIR